MTTDNHLRLPVAPEQSELLPFYHPLKSHSDANHHLPRSGFKVQCGDIEDKSDTTSKHFHSVFHTDVLVSFTLARIKEVHIPVDIAQLDIFCKMRFKVFICGDLAQWLTYAGYYRISKDIIIYLTESNTIIDAIQDSLRHILKATLNP